MASTQKTPSRNTTSARAQATTKKKPAAQQKTPPPSVWSRITAGAVCFLLAMFLILNLCGVRAVVIDLLASCMRGLFGYGTWMFVPALLLCAYLFLFKRKEPVTLRIWCAMLVPLLFGAILHVAMDQDLYQLSLRGLNQLWTDGLQLQCGGAISGFLALLFSQLFSSIGASILFSLAFCILLLGALHITPERILQAVRNAYHYFRDLRYYEDDELYDYDTYDDEVEEMPAPPARPRARRKALDLPVDDPPLLQETAAAAEKKATLFNKQPRVKRPDEVLNALHPTADAGVAEEEIVPEAAPPAPAPEPIPTPAPAPEPIIERELSKSERKELIREHTESVARDVADALVSSAPADYEYPSLHLLHEALRPSEGAVQEELSAIQKRLSDTISSFGIVAKISGAVRGPSITRYEVELEQGVRLNKLTNLSDDIALALGAASVRIAPVPGKISLVGIEVPNQKITPVPIREVLSSDDFSTHSSKVSFAVGKDIGGNYIIGDIARLPHLLIAGTTGSGKSVCTNSLIISMLYKARPDEVRLIMVDPKMVELSIYNGIPHLLIPVVTDPKKAAGALQWAVTEMMKRYRMFSEVGVRDLASYNQHVAKEDLQQKLPQIVVVIDELADLMLVAAKEVEESICRVAQMGRAAGMHLIIATQRPSADVITGLMKANIPSRIAFAVASSLESRIILDTQGAEKLVGKGDMLWFPLGSGKPLRVQGCLIDDQDVAAVVAFVKASGDVTYDESVLQEIEQHVEEQGRGSKASASSSGADALSDADGDLDELYPDAVEIVLELGQASVSMLQRRLKLGYSRAARLVDQMEDRGIVGPFEGSKPRQLLLTRAQWDVMQGRAADPTEPDPVIVSYEPEAPDDASAPSLVPEMTAWNGDMPPWEDE